MIDTSKYKLKLEKELALVERELKSVARKNPQHANEWEPVETEIDADHADEGDVADNLESFSENSSLLDPLEIQYREIKAALARIAAGTYGICEVSGKEIPEERLEANPSARTRIEYATTKSA